MQSKYTKINSLTQTPSLPQILAYILFIIMLATFYPVIQRNMATITSKMVMHIIFPIIYATTFIIFLITSIIDPSDPFMIRYRNDELMESDNIDGKLFCDLCISYVCSDAKHCRTCGRCVRNFDHHCIWLNNCIGGANYVPFFILICGTFFTILIYLVSVGLLWTEYAWHDFLPAMIFLWIISIVLLLFELLLFNLIIFHIYIRCNGQTTHEFIMEFQRSSKKVHNLQITNNTEEKFGHHREASQIKLNTNMKGKVLNIEMDGSEKVKSVEGELQLGNTGEFHSTKQIQNYSRRYESEEPKVQYEQQQYKSVSNRSARSLVGNSAMLNVCIGKNNAVHPRNSEKFKLPSISATKKEGECLRISKIRIQPDY